jgi:hypothetical protein
MLVIDSYRCMFRSQTGGAPPPGGTDPYIWFSALDLNTIPFHVAAGAWGSHRPIQEAAAPVTTSSGTAGTTTQFRDALLTPGTEVTLTDFITGVSVNTAGSVIRDIDVIVPTGTGLLGSVGTGNAPSIGRYTGPSYSTIERLRFRGSTLGAFSGGQIHNLTISSDFSDLIVEGLQLSGPEGTDNSAAIVITGDDLGRQGSRIAIHNNRANCGGGFYIGGTNDLIACNNSILTAQGTTDPVDAWGFRQSGGGNHVFYGNDIRASTARGGTTNNTYHRLRISPYSGSRYYWAKNNILVDRVQARILIIDAAFGGGSGTLEGAWFEGNLVIGTYAAGSNGAELRITDATYGRIINNTIQSDIITSVANLTLGAPVTDGDKTTGNVFEALPGSDPAWGAVGDPSGIDWTP